MQPTARSVPSASSATCTDPALWLRSHNVKAPASRATALIAAIGATYAER